MQSRVLRLVLEVFSLGTIAGAILLTAINWTSLPASIPVHFNIHGTPDGFGSRWFLVAMPALMVAIYLLHTAVARFPSLSAKPYRTKEQNERNFAMVQSLMPWLKAEQGALFVYIQWSMIATAHGTVAGLSPLIMAGLLIAMFVTVAAHLIRR